MVARGHSLVVLLAVGLIGSSAGCAESTVQESTDTDAAPLVEAGGVRVSASFETPTLVRVRFEPLQPGFHIYSLTLPEGGVDGLGVPTRVVAGTAVRQTGPARSDVRSVPLRLPSLGVTLPVYPDGPVDVTLPVEEEHPGGSSVIVTYGACSDSQCLVPVRGLEVGVAR